MTLTNSIVAGNTAGSRASNIESFGPPSVDLTNSKNNLIGDAITAGGLNDKSTDPTHSNFVGNNGAGTLDIASILTSILSNNGRPTLTHALVPGSRALNAGDNALIPGAAQLDQRGVGFPRILNSTVDIGAVELATLAAVEDLIVNAADFVAANAHHATLILSGGKLHVFKTGTTMDLVPARNPALVNRVLITAENNFSNKLTIDFTGGNPIPITGVVFDGGEDIIAPINDVDTLELKSGTVTTVSHTFANAGSGTVSVDERVVSYTRLVPSLLDTLTATNRTFTFSAANDDVTLDASATAGRNVISTAGATPTSETVTFTNPAPDGSLTINTGDGTDTLRMTGVGIGFSQSVMVTVNGGNAPVGTFDSLIGRASAANDFAITTANDTGTLKNGMMVTNFSAFENLTGGTGTDTLTGPILANVWNLTGAGAGNINGLLNFTLMDNLTGNVITDTFKFGASAGSITGTLNAAGGADTLDYSALSAAASVNLETGIATRMGRFTLNTIESVIGGSGRDTLTGKNSGTAFAITSDDAGTATTAAVTVGFSSVENLVGGTGVDSFTFSDTAEVSGSFNGGTGTSDSATFAAYTSGVSVNFATGVVTVSGSATFGISAIESVTGSSSSTGDSVTSQDSQTTWTINTNAGSWTNSAGKFSFSQIETATGSATSNDDFNFSATGSLLGSLNGGGGTDTLNLTAITTNRNVTLTGVPDATGFSGNEAAVASGFNGINTINVTTAATDTLTGITGRPAYWELDGTNRYIDTNVSGVALSFSGFEGLNAASGASNTFVISGTQTFNLAGSSAADTFTFANGATLTGSIDGNAGSDTLNFASYTSGLTVSLTTTTADGFTGTTAGTPNPIIAGFRDIDSVIGGALDETISG